jgi:hypothetical protein
MLTFDVYIIKINGCLPKIFLIGRAAMMDPFLERMIYKNGAEFAGFEFGFSTLSVVKGELILRIVSTSSCRWSVSQWFGVKEPRFWGTYIERRKIRWHFRSKKETL